MEYAVTKHNLNRNPEMIPRNNEVLTNDKTKDVKLGILGMVILSRTNLNILKLDKPSSRAVVCTCVGLDLKTRFGIRIEYFHPPSNKIKQSIVDALNCTWGIQWAYGFRRKGLKITNRRQPFSFTDENKQTEKATIKYEHIARLLHTVLRCS